jgi:hypothetical protein
MWTRVALLNQFTADEVKLLDRSDSRCGLIWSTTNAMFFPNQAKKHSYLSARTPSRTVSPESYWSVSVMTQGRIPKPACKSTTFAPRKLFSTIPLRHRYQKVHFRITTRGMGGARMRFRRHIDADFVAEQLGNGAGKDS